MKKSLEPKRPKVVGIDGKTPKIIKGKNSLVMVDKYINKYYPKTRFNIVTGKGDFGVSDKTFDDVYVEMQIEANIKVSKNDFASYLKSNYVNKFDPFIDYFEGLKGKWNADDKDHIDQLANHIKAKDQPFFNVMFKKHLVRSVKQAINVGYANRIVLVLQSKDQDLGKSTFIRALNPFGDEHYFEEITDDTKLMLTKCFILNIEELENMNRVSVGKLKALISSTHNNVRTFYTQTLESLPRRASIYASTNDNDFLSDDKNTRWLVCEITGVNWGYSTDVNFDGIWAQAANLYYGGFNYELTQEEKHWLKEKAEGFKIQTKEMGFIQEYFRESQEHTSTATIIASYLMEYKQGVATLSSVYIGRALSSLGYESKIKDGKKCWCIEHNDGRGEIKF